MAVSDLIVRAGAKTFGLTFAARSHQKTLRRNYFSATKAVLPFYKTHEAIFPNLNTVFVAETEIDAARFPAHIFVCDAQPWDLTGFTQTSAIHAAMMNAELTLPAFPRTLARKLHG